MLAKVVSWCRDHIFVVIAGVVLVILVLGFSATPSDFDHFNEALANMKRHYQKSERSADAAVQAAGRRSDRAGRQLLTDTKIADAKFVDAVQAVDRQREHVESDTKRDLRTDRQKVAHDIQEDLGL